MIRLFHYPKLEVSLDIHEKLDAKPLFATISTPQEKI